jgi:hypothetical protein
MNDTISLNGAVLMSGMSFTIDVYEMISQLIIGLQIKRNSLIFVMSLLATLGYHISPIVSNNCLV